jgi:hypothetical protein
MVLNLIVSQTGMGLSSLRKKIRKKPFDHTTTRPDVKSRLFHPMGMCLCAKNRAVNRASSKRLSKSIAIPNL